MTNKIVNALMKTIVITIILAGLILITFIFLDREDAASVTSKNEEEIKYLDTKLVSLINSLNNIELQNYKVTLTKVEAKSNASGSQSKNEQQENGEQDKGQSGSNKEETEISKMEEETSVTENAEPDWKTIEGELELLYSTWPTIVLDLNNVQINRDDILAFSNTLDEVILNVKKQDKTLTAIYLAKLYSYLPKFLDKNYEDEIKRKTLETKTYLINAYAFAETENFEKMTEEITKAESIFTSLVNDTKYVNDQRKYNINREYILIEEIKNSLITNDKGIFYVKYKNTLEGLNILS